MPSKEEHLHKASCNEEFVKDIGSARSRHLEWVVTGVFYAGLHLVDAYLAKTAAQHPATHRDRYDCLERAIRQNSRIRDLFKLYRSLRDDSQDARYLPRRFSCDEVCDEVLPRFTSLKALLRPYLG
jgi:hypothetical protein